MSINLARLLVTWPNAMRFFFSFVVDDSAGDVAADAADGAADDAVITPSVESLCSSCFLIKGSRKTTKSRNKPKYVFNK